MGVRKKSSARRSAAQWALLLKAWEKSGETAKAFAKARGIAPRSLAWWKWRLRNQPPGPTRNAPQEMRLVGVQVEPPPGRAEAPSAPAAWELVTARGDVLRVYPGTACSDILDVIQAIASRRDGT